MTLEQAKELPPGIYFIHWKGGGGSVAAIGIEPDGSTWVAPTNWVRPATHFTDHTSRDLWDKIDKVEFITDQEIEKAKRGII